MALAIYQKPLTDEAGNVQANTSVEIRTDPGNVLATIYSDRDGAVPIANPTTSDSNGILTFYVAGGAYKITPSGGTPYRYVAIGTMAEYDITQLDSAVDNGFTDRFGAETIFVEPTGVGDDYAAFNTAWTAANALNRSVILIPPGTYTIGTQLPTLTKDTSVMGAGQTQTTLIFEHAGAAIRWNGLVNPASGGNVHVPSFRGMQLLAGLSTSTIAISVIRDTASSAPSWTTVKFADLNIGGDGAGGYWSSDVIYVDDMPNPVFDNVNIQGNLSLTPNGIHIEGFSVGPKFINCNSHACVTGYRIDNGDTEGAYFYGCESILCDYGIVKDNAVNEPLVAIIGGHHSSNIKGIYLNNCTEAMVIGTSMWAATNNWIGIHITGSTGPHARGTRIIGNGFQGGKALGYTGTVCTTIDQSNGPCISGNVFYDAATGLTLGVSALSAEITGNTWIDCTTDISNSSLTTRIEGLAVPTGSWSLSGLRNARAAPMIETLARLGYA